VTFPALWLEYLRATGRNLVATGIIFFSPQKPFIEKVNKDRLVLLGHSLFRKHSSIHVGLNSLASLYVGATCIFGGCFLTEMFLQLTFCVGSSVKHKYDGAWDGVKTKLTTCNPNDKEFTKHPQELVADEELIFSYDIKFLVCFFPMILGS
jgi:hypothetical protein